jgi:hypothetical protein
MQAKSSARWAAQEKDPPFSVFTPRIRSWRQTKSSNVQVRVGEDDRAKRKQECSQSAVK